MRRVAEIGVELVVPDRQRVLVHAGLPILHPPDAATFDETSAGRACQNPEGGCHRIVAGYRFDRDDEIEGQGRDRPCAHGGTDEGRVLIMITAWSFCLALLRRRSTQCGSRTAPEPQLTGEGQGSAPFAPPGMPRKDSRKMDVHHPSPKRPINPASRATCLDLRPKV